MKKQILSILAILVLDAVISFAGFRAGKTESAGNTNNTGSSDTDAVGNNGGSGATVDFRQLKEQNLDIYTDKGVKREINGKAHSLNGKGFAPFFFINYREGDCCAEHLQSNGANRLSVANYNSFS